jgi:hypothetical protein
MTKLHLKWRTYVALMAVAGVFSAGLVLGCGKSNSDNSSSNSSSSVEAETGTGEVVFTGRIQ